MSTTASESRSTRLEELIAGAQHARHRFDLYKARVYGPRATSVTRLKELERASEMAERRLKRVQHDP